MYNVVSHGIPANMLSATGNPAGNWQASVGMFLGCCSGSTPCDESSAQNFSTMKNPRKQDNQRPNGMLFDTFTTETADIHIFPERYYPEPFSPVPVKCPPEEESFRDFLKSRLEAKRAPSHLLQKIKRSIHLNDL